MPKADGEGDPAAAMEEPKPEGEEKDGMPNPNADDAPEDDDPMKAMLEEAEKDAKKK
jgi:hypothetical protein